MKQRLKRPLALLMTAVLLLGLLPSVAFAAEEGNDLSGRFTVPSDSEKIFLKSNQEIYPDTEENYEKYEERVEQLHIIVNFKFEEADGSDSVEISDGDYILVPLFTADKENAVSFGDEPTPLYFKDDQQKAYAYATVECTEQGGKYIYSCKITFTDAAENQEQHTGEVSLSGFVNVPETVGEILTLTKNGDTIAEIKRVQSTQNFYAKETPAVLKDCLGPRNSQKFAQLLWDIKFQSLIPQQFVDYYNKNLGEDASKVTGTELNGPLIFRDKMDRHQVAVLDTVTLTFEIYLYDKTVTSQIDSNTQMMVLPYRQRSIAPEEGNPIKTDAAIRLNLEQNTGEGKLFTKIENGDIEKQVTETAMSWGVVETADGQELIINLGTQGKDGLTYGELADSAMIQVQNQWGSTEYDKIDKDEWYKNLMAGLRSEAEYIKSVLDDPVYTEKGEIQDEFTGQGMTQSDWEAFQRIYQDSIAYYGGGDSADEDNIGALNSIYVYGFNASLYTMIRNDGTSYDEEAFVVEQVTNTMSVTSGDVELTQGKSVSDTCVNFWRNGIAAKARAGDVVLFKADSMYENEQPKPWTPNNNSSANVPYVDGPIAGAMFCVYDSESGGEPLKFKLSSDGRYQLSEDGSITELPTGQGGEIVLTGLSNGQTYYFQEVTPVEGYYGNGGRVPPRQPTVLSRPSWWKTPAGV